MHLHLPSTALAVRRTTFAASGLRSFQLRAACLVVLGTTLGSQTCTNASIDRIEHDGDYTLANVRLVCRVVNTMRTRLTDEQLFDWCQKIVENGRPE